VVSGEITGVTPSLYVTAGACSTPVNGWLVPISVPPVTLSALVAQPAGKVKSPVAFVVVVLLLQSRKVTVAPDR
jgi:hypothetical protein